MLSYEIKKANNLSAIKNEIQKATLSRLYSKKHRNKSFSLEERETAALDISLKIIEHRRRKSENLRKIINKINKVKHYCCEQPKNN